MNLISIYSLTFLLLLGLKLSHVSEIPWIVVFLPAVIHVIAIFISFVYLLAKTDARAFNNRYK